MVQHTAADGRAALVDAARTLFAAHGIENVSMREVGRTAGHRNTNAVQYHFGDRDELLRAVLAPHLAEVRARRVVLLDQIEGEGGPASLRSLAGALVRPSAAALEDPVGREHLRIVAARVADHTTVRRGGPLAGMGLGRWDLLAKRHMPTTTLPLHRRFSAIHLCFTELGRRAAARRPRDLRLFVSDLVDLTTGVLGADVSDETLRLLEERARD